MYTKRIITPILCTILPALLLLSCKKLVEIDAPVDTITTKQMFATNKEAEWAVTGLYSKLINGFFTGDYSMVAESNYSSGLCTLLGGMSSDDLLPPANNSSYQFVSTNNLNVFQAGITVPLWTTAYKSIFDANAIIEGIEASDGQYLTDSARRQLTGEALSIRAFAYFYLVNFYGGLPLALSTDFNKTASLSRSPVNKVYEQITADLKRAIPLLQTDYTAGKMERVRINRWFAEALLARVSLYAGDYGQAITSAGTVIGHSQLYSLEDPANAFLNTSREAILQLKQTFESPYGYATPEGYSIRERFTLPGSLISSYETNDKRKSSWVRFSNNNWYPDKYKLGSSNSYNNTNEYYVVMRLSELYLIRAEASMLLSASNTTSAIADLNEIRQRSGATLFPDDLTAAQITEAIAAERRRELFAEWGHRWLDLKRTGKAREVLSAITYKQPWKGDFQLLYPIPQNDLRDNPNLKQNEGYVNL